MLGNVKIPINCSPLLGQLRHCLIILKPVQKHFEYQMFLFISSCKVGGTMKMISWVLFVKWLDCVVHY